MAKKKLQSAKKPVIEDIVLDPKDLSNRQLYDNQLSKKK